MYRVRSNLLNILVILLDLISIISSLLLANVIRHHSSPDLRGISSVLMGIMAAFVISYFIIYFMANFNNGFLKKGPLHEFWDVLKLNLAMLAVSMVIVYFTRVTVDYSRLVFAFFTVIDTFLMLSLHTLLKKMLPRIIKQATGTRQLVVVTTQSNMSDLLKNINASSELSYHVPSVFIPDYAYESDDLNIDSFKYVLIKDVDQLITFCKKSSVDEVLFSLPLNEMTSFETAIEKISSMGIAVHISVDLFFPQITSSKLLTKFGEYNAITYADRFLSFRQLFFKRVLDIFGGVIGMLLLIPITIIVAPLIKLESPGPIFFSQKRVGRNGRIFNIYKFRSMYIDAEARKKELLQQNEMNGLMFKMEKDPRITKIGKFLRKTSLDEFPQFYNVMRGDMSLVGTRPPTLDEFEHYKSHHKKRLSITPGLTGLWQVNGRNQVTDFEEVVRLDVQYINEWSFGLDIKILLKTIGVVLKGNGAI